jgi:hypothetical protein
MKENVSNGTRRGEKLGWIGGWLGGSLWIIVLPILLFSRQEIVAAAIAFVLFCAAMVLVPVMAPWRHPKTPYFLLLLPLYAVFLGALLLAIVCLNLLQEAHMRPWQFLWILPCFTPLFILGRRRWIDGE